MLKNAKVNMFFLKLKFYWIFLQYYKITGLYEVKAIFFMCVKIYFNSLE